MADEEITDGVVVTPSEPGTPEVESLTAKIDYPLYRACAVDPFCGGYYITSDSEVNVDESPKLPIDFLVEHIVERHPGTAAYLGRST